MRIAIAQEIHDGIAQDLIALGYQIDLVLAEPDTPSSVRHEMRSIRHNLSNLIVKVRNEILNLRKGSDFWGEIQNIADHIKRHNKTTRIKISVYFLFFSAFYANFVAFRVVK